MSTFVFLSRNQTLLNASNSTSAGNDDLLFFKKWIHIAVCEHGHFQITWWNVQRQILQWFLLFHTGLNRPCLCLDCGLHQKCGDGFTRSCQRHDSLFGWRFADTRELIHKYLLRPIQRHVDLKLWKNSRVGGLCWWMLLLLLCVGVGLRHGETTIKRLWLQSTPKKKIKKKITKQNQKILSNKCKLVHMYQQTTFFFVFNWTTWHENWNTVLSCLNSFAFLKICFLPSVG